ncbi:MAG: cysteine desulfurase family protein [Planctomycetota bacterium]|jgi:cysteine desulfurase
MDRIYLDNNATTPLLDEVREAMADALGCHGNPSSAHASGREARRLLSDAREAVAALMGAGAEQLVFTSGGTEANNLAVIGGARAAVAAGAARHVVTTAVEHPAVDDACEHLHAEGFEVSRVAVDQDGLPAVGDLVDAVREDTALLAVMLVQNETGGVLPVEEAFCGARERSAVIRLHSDAVQALGKVDLAPVVAVADTVAVSAHKIHGPKGVGALWARPGREPGARAFGGKQERGLRTGTENVPGAVGFGVAAVAARDHAEDRHAHVDRLGELLEDSVLGIDGARLNGPGRERRHSGTVNVSFAGVRGDLLLMALDSDGIDVSTGSACASGAPVPSRVLLALGCDENRAREAVRISVGALNAEKEIHGAVDAIARAVQRIRTLGADRA